MTRTEFIKLLCISCGYANNIKIEKWTDSLGCTQYCVSAENDEEDEIESSCGDLMETIYNLVRDIHNNAICNGEAIDISLLESFHINSAPWYLKNWPQKMIFDDEKREQARIKEQKRTEYIEKCCELENKFFEGFREKPCHNCKLKEPVRSPYSGEIIEDSVNENCDKHFRHICDIVKEWWDERDNKRKEFYASEEYDKLKEEYKDEN